MRLSTMFFTRLLAALLLSALALAYYVAIAFIACDAH